MELEEYLEGIRNCPDEDLTDRKNGGMFVSRLQRDFGIYDNWPILLGENQDKSTRIVRDLSLYEMKLGGPLCLYDRVLADLSSEAKGKDNPFLGRYAFKSQSVHFYWTKSKGKDEDATVKLEFSSKLDAHYERDIRRIVSELGRSIPQKANVEPLITTVFDYKPGVVIVQVLNLVGGNDTTWDGADGPHRQRQLKNFDVAFSLHPYNDNQKFPYHMRHRMMAKVIDQIGTYALKKGLSLCFPHSIPKEDEEEKDFSKIVYFNT